MAQNFYISDLHFGHKNIIKFDNRPFFSVKDMEEQLIDNWNSVVTDNDTVYHLGDFCWGRDSEEWGRLLDKLNGKKVMVLGNHDLTHFPRFLMEKVVKVTHFECFSDKNKKVVLSHYPILAYPHSYDEKTYMLYGHVHVTREYTQIREFVNTLRNTCNGEYDNRGNLIHVGCMMPYMDYTPRTLEQLIGYKNEGLA